MAKFTKYREDFILFLEAGFIAVNQTDEDSAVKLFKAAETLNPKNALVKIGYGYLYLHKLELKKAIHNFEEVLKADPKNEMAKAFLGIALSMTPNDALKGEKMLVDTEKSDDKSIKRLAHASLDFIDRFVKKTPTPVEVKKQR